MNSNEKLISSELQLPTLISQVFLNIIFSDGEMRYMEKHGVSVR